jgi:hypothetical protein
MKPTGPAPTDEDEEPQNALTEKFTEKEWLRSKSFVYVPSRFAPHVIYGTPTTDSCLVSSPRYLREGI